MTKQDLKSRAHYQEVAEFFEELLQAVDKDVRHKEGPNKGLMYLPPRLNRAPGQVDNKAKQDRAQREADEKRDREKREAKREARQENLKHTIEDTNYAGRGMPTRDFKKEEAKKNKEEAEAKGMFSTRTKSNVSQQSARSGPSASKIS